MHSSDSSPKRANSGPGETEQRRGPNAGPSTGKDAALDAGAAREAASPVPVPHDIDDFLRFLEAVEAVGGQIRKPRTITVGSVFVL